MAGILDSWFILIVALGYLSLLFGIAYYGDKRAEAGRVIANSYVYALSISVYCTSWTFFGSVGRAASSGLDFLPIYLGPTLMVALSWLVLRKMLRISKANRITSIADFLASRYGKSTLLGGLVTLIAVAGVTPYISLQLKAVATSFNVLIHYPDLVMPVGRGPTALFADTALYVALIMAAFSILFGTRHIDATEHHAGMVLAVAFESVVKLVAFLMVGLFVCYGMYEGFGSLFERAATDPELQRLFVIEGVSGYVGWLSLMVLAMLSIICLPRQFHIAVVENVDEAHLRKAVWLFPLYLLLINVFVLPIAVAGRIEFSDAGVDPDTYVLTLPMLAQQEALALFAFIGGLSAATAMVIVETVALSTMVCNDLVMSALLRVRWLGLAARTDLSRLFIGIRRAAIVFVLLLGYLYYRMIGESYTLVTIGLVSFAAAAQFAPALIGGIFWRGATRKGAIAGLSAGFLAWLYTLLLPSFARSGWLSMSFVEEGPFGWAILKPHALFGLDALDTIPHALFWSGLFNLSGYIAVSLLTRQSPIERAQATRFVEVFNEAGTVAGGPAWHTGATVQDLQTLAARFLGERHAAESFASQSRMMGQPIGRGREASTEWMHFTERLLAGAIGTASARVMVASVVKGEGVGIEQVMQILDEASHVIEYSRQLEQKSTELERATSELRAANERLKELDRLKDDFLSTVTHELRTPLTSIRAFSEILRDNPDLTPLNRRKFVEIISRESERLSRLINQLLDMAKIEAGRFDWRIADVDLKEVVEDAVAATSQLFTERQIALAVDIPDRLPHVRADRDQLIQVLINLLSNAVKFCKSDSGRVEVAAKLENGSVRVSVADNGPGIPRKYHRSIFEKFQQVDDALSGKPQGTGLGLAISRSIIEFIGGRIWVESAPGRGATFLFEIPPAKAAAAAT